MSDERMLAACRNDQEDELNDILTEGDYDLSFTDSIGNTAAHIAAKTGSLGCLELLVNLDDIDLDVVNRLEGDTPLHSAVQYQDQDLDMAVAMVELLLAAEADPRIRNRQKCTPIMLVNPDNTALKTLLTDAAVAYELGDDDLADDDDYGSDDDDQPSD
ncbi:hypothetical protein DFQ28_006647 [Apophysomyces sp. BC1034]|nr:hypothetical protein DFQ30_004684 [Apophysomyces sp. BC1015]KAG0182544.1 hypothetical protein DFQ29_003546 [Apophysomyces sp. BC1021]KAG0193053.1 hypothetical protein DFQ28_006647 [Apophysomyces sp. BC1034]